MNKIYDALIREKQIKIAGKNKAICKKQFVKNKAILLINLQFSICKKYSNIIDFSDVNSFNLTSQNS